MSKGKCEMRSPEFNKMLAHFDISDEQLRVAINLSKTFISQLFEQIPGLELELIKVNEEIEVSDEQK